MLTFLLQYPVIAITAVLLLAFVVTKFTPAPTGHGHRVLILTSSLVALFIGVLSCLAFDKSDLGFQFLTQINLLEEFNLSLTFGVDGLSMLLLLLTLFIFPVLFLASWRVSKNTRTFFEYLLSMEILLVLTFTTLDLLYFFVLFESLLIPMFLLIGQWGARDRRIKAAYYFFLYTFFGSLFMLFGIIYLYFLVGSTNYFVLLNTVLAPDQQKLIWLCFFLAFAVKMPLFPLHIWLPEAHVEAPTAGSMLLASLLLKLGGYGFLRFSLTCLNVGSLQYSSLVSACALLGVIYCSLSTLRQIDLKRIVAYSSVAHMNLVMLGLFSFTQQGIEGAIFFMIAHGVVSTGLFFCVGNLYDRHHTRLLHYYGGLVTVMPLFSSAFFALTLANMSFPGTANFIGELLMLAGIHSMNSHVLLLASPSIVLSAAYSTFTYNRVSFGTLKTTYIRQFNDLTRADVVTVLSLVFAMLGLGLAASFILDFAHVAVKNILLFPLPPSISTLATPDAIVVSSEGISGTAINFPSWEELRQYFTYLITAFVLVQFINCPKCLFFIVEHRKLLGAIIIFFVFALLVKKSLQVGAKRT